jgi:hypothetical protein
VAKLDESLLSQHPVDLLIREIVDGSYTATGADIDQITERVATASFNPQLTVVPQTQRGLPYLDRTLQHVESQVPKFL